MSPVIPHAVELALGRINDGTATAEDVAMIRRTIVERHPEQILANVVTTQGENLSSLTSELRSLRNAFLLVSVIGMLLLAAPHLRTLSFEGLGLKLDTASHTQELGGM